MQLDTAPARGKFIVFEGIDGAGKSTQLKAFCEWLHTRLNAVGKQVVVTREPGGTALGEDLRGMLLQRSMQIETEALLMFAARCEHIACVIRPALERGDWVVSDRFTDATFAYQGGGRGMPAEKLEVLESWVQGALRPDLTILLDLPVDIARQRAIYRAQEQPDPTHAVANGHKDNGAGQTQQLDKFESQSPEFFSRIRAAYLARAAQAPQRYFVIDATQDIQVMQNKIQACLDDALYAVSLATIK